MTVARRVARLENSLGPQQTVLAWLADAQERFIGIRELALDIVDLAWADTPASRIGRQVELGVRDAMKGQDREAVDKSARRAVGDAIFLYTLVLELNLSTHLLTQVESQRALALLFVPAGLIAEPQLLGPDPAEGWRIWREATRSLDEKVAIEEKARALVQQDYLDGREALFADAAHEWADLRGSLKALSEVAAVTAPKILDRASDTDDRFEQPVRLRARQIADDARARTLTSLGYRERAVAVMERRLRGDSAWMQPVTPVQAPTL